MWHAWERREKYTRFWWESPKERDHLEDRGVDTGWDENGSWGDWLGVWSGFNWLRIGDGGGLL
jgi:hypothetical protein